MHKKLPVAMRALTRDQYILSFMDEVINMWSLLPFFVSSYECYSIFMRRYH